MRRFFVVLTTLVVHVVRLLGRSQADLILEILALRQQVTALKRERPRPWLDDADRGLSGGSPLRLAEVDQPKRKAYHSSYSRLVVIMVARRSA